MHFNTTELLHWISIHGEYVLFFLLALGIIGLPIPDETILVASGTLAAKQVFSYPQTVVFAILGTLCGITISFIIGRVVSKAMIHFLMKKFRVDLKHWYNMEAWFQKYGKWTLSIAYFVPGVRHISGVFAGLMELPYKTFAIYAYIGGVVWSLLFINLGFFFGEKAINLVMSLVGNKILSISVLLIFLLIVLSFCYKYFQNKTKRL